MDLVRAIQVVASQIWLLQYSIGFRHLHVSSAVVHIRCLILARKQLVFIVEQAFVHPYYTFLAITILQFSSVLLPFPVILILRVSYRDLQFPVTIGFLVLIRYCLALPAFFDFARLLWRLAVSRYHQFSFVDWYAIALPCLRGTVLPCLALPASGQIGPTNSMYCVQKWVLLFF